MNMGYDIYPTLPKIKLATCSILSVRRFHYAPLCHSDGLSRKSDVRSAFRFISTLFEKFSSDILLWDRGDEGCVAACLCEYALEVGIIGASTGASVIDNQIEKAKVCNSNNVVKR